MSHQGAPYVDRRLGTLKTDPLYAASFLDWSYNSRPGQWLTRHVLSRPFASALYGWYYKQPWTRRKIAPFTAALNIDLDELTQPLTSFASFSEFISRHIDLSGRPIDPDPGACLCPVDGRLLAYPQVDGTASFPIKSGLFSLRALLANDDLATRYIGGSVAVLRLYLADYHHFHFPDSGTPHEPRVIRGRYFAVTPYSRQWLVPFYSENVRAITLFESDAFRRIAIVEVGAFTIGSIRQTFAPDVRVSRGDRKGYFELGASIVVLLFEPGAIQLDADLCENTRAGLETFVRLGESIGRNH